MIETTIPTARPAPMKNPTNPKNEKLSFQLWKFIFPGGINKSDIDKIYLIFKLAV